MEVGTHLGVGRRGSNGRLKDAIRNKTVDLYGDTLKKQLRPLGSCGFSLFPWAIEPERLSQSNPSVVDELELTKIALKMQQN